MFALAGGPAAALPPASNNTVIATIDPIVQDLAFICSSLDSFDGADVRNRKSNRLCGQAGNRSPGARVPPSTFGGNAMP